MNRCEVLKLGVIGCVGCGGGDGEVTPPDAAEVGAVTMCGAEVCVDLSHPANAALTAINGARALNVPDKIIIVRTSATELAVLSRVCTHQACGIGYVPASMTFACPCHGSKFSLAGTAINGPATRALKRYASRFDEATQTLTITL